MAGNEAMSLEQAIQVLQAHNKWLRTPAHTMEDLVPVAPPAVEVGIAIDVVCEVLGNGGTHSCPESYQPDERGCRNCTDREADCAHLPFEKMPVSHEQQGGCKVVRCTERERDPS